MSAIFSFFNNIFRIEWKLQSILMKFSKNNKQKMDKISIGLGFLYFMVLLLFVIFRNTSTAMITLLFSISILYMIASLLSESLFAFTSVRGFLTSGVMAAVLVFLMLVGFFDAVVIKNFEYENSYILYYLIVILLLIIIWFFFSTFCNAEVATLSNFILSTIVGVIMYLNSIIWPFYTMMGNHLLPEHQISFMLELGYSEAGFISMGLNILILPIFLMLTVGTISCAIKKYWVKKYNFGDDINSINMSNSYYKKIENPYF